MPFRAAPTTGARRPANLVWLGLVGMPVAVLVVGAVGEPAGRVDVTDPGVTGVVAGCDSGPGLGDVPLLECLHREEDRVRVLGADVPQEGGVRRLERGTGHPVSDVVGTEVDDDRARPVAGEVPVRGARTGRLEELTAQTGAARLRDEAVAGAGDLRVPHAQPLAGPPGVRVERQPVGEGTGGDGVADELDQPGRRPRSDRTGPGVQDQALEGRVPGPVGDPQGVRARRQGLGVRFTVPRTPAWKTSGPPSTLT